MKNYFTPQEELEMLRSRLEDARTACAGKGAGAERQLFERLESEYAEKKHYLVSGNTLENFRANARAFEERNKHRRSIWK